jgi:peptidoglycan/LPS O-acetylase OafA/YrhL
MTYRSEIDGLRAIAVMAVILYHAGVPGFSGGLVGVDVFFVISGFLIGGIVLSERSAGVFSYRTFYGRRIRRIVPALLVVVLAVLAIGLITLTPDKMRHLGGSAAAVLLFISNVWFFVRTDYFNPAVDLEPLVHTWSLAVEEQFYILLPIILFLLWPLGLRRIAVVLAALAMLSLSWAVATNGTQPESAFYLIHTRAWELLAGVLAAMIGRRDSRQASWLGSLGLALILVSVSFIPAGVEWPGMWTVPAVVGTVLVLLFGATASPAHWILTRRPCVWIGLVSYSAYLWHQPVLSYYHIVTDGRPMLPQALGLIGLTLGLAAVTWRFIEQPFRQRQLSRGYQIGTLGASSALILAVAVGGHVTGGYPSRLPDEVRSIAEFRNSRAPRYRDCNNSRNVTRRIAPHDSCRFGPDAAAMAAPQLAIWGDSHAAVFAQPLGERMASLGLGTIQLTTGACPALMGIRIRGLRPDDFCTTINAGVLAYLIAADSVTDVVLHGYWNNYMQPDPVPNTRAARTEPRYLAFPVDASDSLPETDRRARIAQALEASVSALLAAGKRVYIVYPLPEAGFEVPDVYARAVWRTGRGAPDLSFDAAEHVSYSAPARDLLDSLGDRPGLSRIDASAVFCDSMQCRVVAQGVPLFHDTNHPSLPAAERIAEIVARNLRSTGAEP